MDGYHQGDRGAEAGKVPKNMRAAFERQRKFRDEWELSPERILMPAGFAYLAVTGYYWLTGFPDAWIRGFAPVLCMVTYSLAMPLARRFWFRRAHSDILTDNQSAKHLDDTDVAALPRS